MDGRLEDLILDPPAGDTTPMPGDIFRAKVDRLVPKLGAAFVKLLDGQTGFLREAKGLREGETPLIQVVSIPETSKATPVTTRVLYKTRAVIHTPHAPGVNVSRQIRGTEDRARLASLVDAALAGEARDLGFIVRTAALGMTDDEIRADIADALAQREAAEAGTPHRETAATVARREWDGRPETGAFGDAGVWDDIDRLAGPRADLPSGGWLSVDPTPALVAIDVNTGGGFQGGDGLTANLEAAREIPRQLRLRGLGGLVVVDFAPLPKRDRRRVEDALKTSFGRDPIETSLAGWTTLGLFEIQRKRERRPLSELLSGA